MTYTRYYYNTLSPHDKKVYGLIYEAIEGHKASVTVPKPSVSLMKIFKFLSLDNPHLYYVELTQFSYYDTGDEVEIELEYFYSPEDIEILDKKVKKVLGRMLSRMSGKTDYEKVKAVHDLLVEHVSYDYESLENLRKYYTVSNSVLGVLFMKKAVCEGISKVAKYLLNIMDVKCIVAEGFSVKENGPHAWNMVKIDGKYYHLDITWDINVSDEDLIRYDYFCLCDEDINKDHKFGHVYPVCTDKADHYRRKGACVTDLVGFENKIVEARERGEKHLVFKYVGKTADYEKDLSDLMTRAVNTGKTGSLSWHFNNDQRVCRVSFT